MTASYVQQYKERRTCFHCNEVGHILKNCPYKNKGKQHVIPEKMKQEAKPVVKPVKKPIVHPDSVRPLVKPVVKPVVKPMSQVRQPKVVNQSNASSSRGSRDMTPKVHYKRKFIERRACFHYDMVDPGPPWLGSHCQINDSCLMTQGVQYCVDEKGKGIRFHGQKLTMGPSSEFSSRKRECADKQDEDYNSFDDVKTDDNLLRLMTIF
ncbi:hypothetical protein L1987_13276 [Smallanthus sonchifolius]|uniref:Uncharacterized protein n=1 Tax=Smallanthus sonchifolius TaxID=185202 RepID=A0ACB9JIR9_9ASTR|nr:hypothetical protein L1987_13276 [Smallanthus sonchifolius]